MIVFVVFFLLSAAGQSRTSEGSFPLIYVVSRNLTLLPLRKTFFRLAIQAALQTVVSQLAGSAHDEWASPGTHQFPIICGSEHFHPCKCVTAGINLERVEIEFS